MLRVFGIGNESCCFFKATTLAWNIQHAVCHLLPCATNWQQCLYENCCRAGGSNFILQLLDMMDNYDVKYCLHDNSIAHTYPFCYKINFQLETAVNDSSVTVSYPTATLFATSKEK